MSKADLLIQDMYDLTKELQPDDKIVAVNEEGHQFPLGTIGDLRKALAPGKNAITGLQYRPYAFDDWGTIRDMNGRIFGSIRINVSQAVENDHRRNETDPYEYYGRKFIDCLSKGE